MWRSTLYFLLNTFLHIWHSCKLLVELDFFDFFGLEDIIGSTSFLFLNFSRATGMNSKVFTNSAPLGRVGHRVAMSVCLSVCVCLRHRVQFLLGLSLALRSHDQIPASHWSTLPPSFGNLETWRLGNSEKVVDPPKEFFFYKNLRQIKK